MRAIMPISRPASCSKKTRSSLMRVFVSLTLEISFFNLRFAALLWVLIYFEEKDIWRFLRSLALSSIYHFRSFVVIERSVKSLRHSCQYAKQSYQHISKSWQAFRRHFSKMPWSSNSYFFTDFACDFDSIHFIPKRSSQYSKAQSSF